MASMMRITVRLAEATLRELRQRARREGRSVSALIRKVVERAFEGNRSAYAMIADLAGYLEGSGRAGTNARRRWGDRRGANREP